MFSLAGLCDSTPAFGGLGVAGGDDGPIRHHHFLVKSDMHFSYKATVCDHFLRDISEEVDHKFCSKPAHTPAPPLAGGSAQESIENFD